MTDHDLQLTVPPDGHSGSCGHTCEAWREPRRGKRNHGIRIRSRTAQRCETTAVCWHEHRVRLPVSAIVTGLWAAQTARPGCITLH